MGHCKDDFRHSVEEDVRPHGWYPVGHVACCKTLECVSFNLGFCKLKKLKLITKDKINKSKHHISENMKLIHPEVLTL